LVVAPLNPRAPATTVAGAPSTAAQGRGLAADGADHALLHEPPVDAVPVPVALAAAEHVVVGEGAHLLVGVQAVLTHGTVVAQWPPQV
jgi:hypothetical protein